MSELSRARHPAAWSRSLLRGLRTFDVTLPGPDHGRARLLRFAPGARFPQHRHHGDERLLVLEGAFADDTGREVWAGQEATQEAGSSHALVILGNVPCVTAVMEQGLEFTQGWLRLVNHFVR